MHRDTGKRLLLQRCHQGGEPWSAVQWLRHKNQTPTSAHMNDRPANSADEPSGARPSSHFALASTAMAAPISATSPSSKVAPHAMFC